MASEVLVFPEGPLSTSITIIGFDETRFQERAVETIEECFPIKDDKLTLFSGHTEKLIALPVPPIGHL